MKSDDASSIRSKVSVATTVPKSTSTAQHHGRSPLATYEDVNVGDRQCTSTSSARLSSLQVLTRPSTRPTDMGTGYGDGGMGSTDFNSGRPLPASPRTLRASSLADSVMQLADLLRRSLPALYSRSAAILPQQYAAVAELWPAARRPRLPVDLAGQPTRAGRRARRLPVRRSDELRLQQRTARAASEYRQRTSLYHSLSLRKPLLIEPRFASTS